ncbi:hypothetical protein ACWGJQ_23650 [Peribacillus simplex]
MQCLTILSLRKAVIIEETRQKKYEQCPISLLLHALKKMQQFTQRFALLMRSTSSTSWIGMTME